MENFNSIIDQLQKDYQFALDTGTGEAYSRLSTIFEELGGYFREYVQGLTEEDVKGVLRKLRNGDTLNVNDIDLIRLWIVDDAQRYMEMENNFEDWKKEMERLMAEIVKYKDRDAGILMASELRALFRDGSRVLADIFYYLQQKDRVARFDQASQSLGPQERSLLIGLLEQKIKSSEL